MNRENRGLEIARSLAGKIPGERLKTDPLYTHAYSGDASYFRLVPKLVAIINSREELHELLKACRRENIGITFRAAGTSLSGQATGDGVLCVLGDGWDEIRILYGGKRVVLGPGTIVSRANEKLRPHNKKIGPDPASVDTCKIGGVVANNSSGMCCGVAQNTYRTMSDMCLVLVDGTELDSSSARSRREFYEKRPDIIAGLNELAARVRQDNELADLIARKYEIKNTVGYSLNALTDFKDPIDIMTHLMVGSEGTLGFVSSITYNCVDDHPYKATALVPFASNRLAAMGVQALHRVGVSAAEFMERKALAKVEHLAGMAGFRHLLSDDSPAVLIEIMAASEEELDLETGAAMEALERVGTLAIPEFSRDEKVRSRLWDIRKGLFASVGAVRPRGSLMLTEDLAVPIDRLADAVEDLRAVLDRHQYHEGVIFGHALAGNLHFQMHADFSRESERRRFEDFASDLARMVSVQYQGSLKAEHGTGRAIAPFVEQEWGEKAYGIMGEIKRLFDPQNLLNPGVLLNGDGKAHMSHIKHMVSSDELVDLCVECGVCEPACPSAGFTMTPRQRIVAARERARLEANGGSRQLAERFGEGFDEAVLDSCAGCSLCSTLCPIGIDTGSMVMNMRGQNISPLGERIARLVAANTGLAENLSRAALFVQGRVPGISSRRLPSPPPPLSLPNSSSPSFSSPPVAGEPDVCAAGSGKKAPLGDIIYFPACPSRIFGEEKTFLDLLPATRAMPVLLQRAGFNPLLPQKPAGLCCGQPFSSKGFGEQGRKVGKKLESTLLDMAGGQRAEIITDASTCARHMRDNGIEARDSIGFLLHDLVKYLPPIRPIEQVAVHHNCASRVMGQQSDMEALAGICATSIAVLDSVGCCGYSGDKGIFMPQLNRHALRFAQNDIPEGCKIGVSSVSTCGVGLSGNLKIPFVSIISLLEYVSRP